MWECPTSVIPERIWRTLGVFWMCYQRRPGFNGMEVARVSLPEDGGVLVQDNWTMWAFGVLENAFYELDGEKHSQHVQSHEEVKRKFGVK